MAIEQIRNGERGLSVRNKLNQLISAFNSNGLGVGTANNIFGDVSGDVNAENLLVSPASNKAAAEGVRDAYFTANPANLAAYNAQAGLHLFLLYIEDGDTVLEAQARIGGAWVRSVALFAVQGVPGSEMALSGLASRRVLFNNDGALASAPARVMDDGSLFIEGVTRVESGTLSVGPFVQLSERGGFLGTTNALGDEFTIVDYRTPKDAPSSVPRYLALLEAENRFDIQTVQTETLNSPVAFNYTPTLLARTNSLIGQVGSSVDNLRFRITDQETGSVVKYYPSEANWIDGIGQAFETGEMTLSFDDTELPLAPGRTLSIEIRYESGTLLGDTNGIPALSAMLQRGEFVDIVNAEGTGGTSLTTTVTASDLPTISPTATNQQLANQAIDSAVSTLQNTIFNSGRSFVRFNDGFTIDNSNLAAFEDKNIIYTAKNDKPLDGATRPDVFLPTDADIAAAGESYPVTFEFTHLGGTTRSTTSNLVRFFFEGEIIGQLLRDDAAVIVKTGVGVDYEVSTGTFSPGDTILPTGVFNLKVNTPINDVATIADELSGVSVVPGDAFLVEMGGMWSGLTVPNNSILVAVVNSPSLLDSAANNDWLLLDNPRVNAKSAALLANFDQKGILFEASRNVQVDPSNVFEFSSEATGVPQLRVLGTNSQGSGRSITYTNVPIQFADLVGGRLMINLNFNITSLSGFAPSFTSVRLQYPGGIEFTFPVTGAPINGNYIAAIDIPNVDYTSALSQDCTLTLFFDFFGESFLGGYTVLDVVNTSKGRLHDAIASLIVTESMPLEARLQAQIDTITGELGSDEASFAAIQDRISPYRNNVSLSPDVNVRYLDSTGSDNFPSVSAMTAVNPLNTEYTMGTTAVFIAVATGVEQAVMNGGTQTLLTSANAQTDPNLELGESETFEGRTYFVYRLSNQAANDVIQTFDLTFVQVVAWQDDIDTLGDDVDRIDAELEHAALNLSDSLIDVLDNNVTVTEESNPTIVATEYNKSFSTNDTQTVFYEANPKTPSGGSHASEAISVSSSKLIVIPEGHVFADGVILQANDGSTATDLVNFVGGQLVANVFVPSVPSGSKTVTVHPLPATQAQRDWYSLPLHTSDLRAEADEIFFTRNVPVAPTTLAFQYRYDANGGHGATQTIDLVIADISVDASVSASLSLPDGESVNVGFDWQASQRRIRVTGTPFASDPNFFIFDMEVGVTFTETRTTPSTPATTRPVIIGLSRATGQDAVIATKVSAGGDLILVGDVAEVDTNYAMTTLFGAGLVGNLTVFTELGTYLNYTQFTPSAQAVVSLENHATLPQFGLFTTEYTHDTVVTFGTQLQAHNSQGDIINLGEELVLTDAGGDRWRLAVDVNGNLTTSKL